MAKQSRSKQRAVSQARRAQAEARKAVEGARLARVQKFKKWAKRGLLVAAIAGTLASGGYFAANRAPVEQKAQVGLEQPAQPSLKEERGMPALLEKKLAFQEKTHEVIFKTLAEELDSVSSHYGLSNEQMVAVKNFCLTTGMPITHFFKTVHRYPMNNETMAKLLDAINQYGGNSKKANDALYSVYAIGAASQGGFGQETRFNHRHLFGAVSKIRLKVNSNQWQLEQGPAEKAHQLILKHPQTGQKYKQMNENWKKIVGQMFKFIDKEQPRLFSN